MFPLSWSRIDWSAFARRRVLGIALAMASTCLLVSTGDVAAQAHPSSGQSVAADEVSAAKRWAGRRGAMRRRWIAHRGRHGGRWGRDDRDQANDHRPGDHRPGDHRPGGPGRGPEGESKPGDHVGKDHDHSGTDPRPTGPKNTPPDRDPDAKPFPPHVIPKEPRAGGPGLSPPPVVPPALAGFGPQAPGSPPPPPPAATRQSPNQGPPNPANRDTFVPNEVLVTVARTAPESIDDAVAQSHGLQVLERMTIRLVDRRIVRYRIADRRPVATLLAALRADARVFEPQPNYYYRTQQDRSAPSRHGGLQYALAKLDADRAQVIARGRGALVAVIDTGADTTHPDLAGAIVESFDAVGTRSVDPHGTAVAGIIAANGILRGVAPDAKLLNVRAFAPGADGGLAATTFNLLRGIEWALSRRARVLNMSFTGPRDALLERGITAASDQGAIIVAAAGNGGDNAPPAYPAAYAPVIAVTAIDAADRRYARANLGRYIALAAPGVDILTASADRDQSGTSFAAAHVSGIIALMLEHNAGMTADAARGALMATADDLGPPGRDEQYGAGRPNALAALRALGRH
jgi:subtilisin family serine protease